MKCSCGHNNDPTSNHCIRCGASLSGQAAAPGEKRRETTLEADGGVGTPLKAFNPPPVTAPDSAPAPASSGRRKTQLEEGGSTPRAGAPAPAATAASHGSGARKKTMLDEGGTGSASSSNASPNAGPPPRAVGWMISFDFNTAGQDYVIRAGKTSVGRSRDNEISLFFDNKASEQHCFIIYRNGVCKVKDNATTNGTMVNGEDIGIGEVHDLNSGDLLTIGSSTFAVTLLDPELVKKAWPKLNE
jgi:hypothetical protein